MWWRSMEGGEEEVWSSGCSGRPELLPHHPPGSGDREIHACSPWQPPQGSFGSHPIGDFLKQFVTWEFMDF